MSSWGHPSQIRRYRALHHGQLSAMSSQGHSLQIRRYWALSPVKISQVIYWSNLNIYSNFNPFSFLSWHSLSKHSSYTVISGVLFPWLFSYLFQTQLQCFFQNTEVSISYLTYLSSDSLLLDIVTIGPGSYLVTRLSVSSRTLNYYLSSILNITMVNFPPCQVEAMSLHLINTLLGQVRVTPTNQQVYSPSPWSTLCHVKSGSPLANQKVLSPSTPHHVKSRTCLHTNQHSFRSSWGHPLQIRRYRALQHSQLSTM